MGDTVTVRRGGSYLRISPSAVERYMAKGYDVVDEAGNVLQGNIPNDINVLKNAYKEHVEEIKKLKEEIAQLKAKPKAEPVKQSKLFGTDAEEPTVEVEEIPEKKTTKKSKKSV